MHKTILLTLSLLTAATAFAAEKSDSVTDRTDYLPNLHGVIRPRFEYDTESGTNRFQIRNARLSLDGYIGQAIDYYAQVDLCNAGSFVALDFWGRFRMSHSVAVQGGQFRMPLGLDTFRGPTNYFFANRSFIGKQMFNFRAIGVKASYDIAGSGITIDGGIFSNSAITAQSHWNKGFAYAARLTYKPGEMTYSAGFGSVKPYGIRANVADAAICWADSRWTVSAEYMYKHYTGNTHDASHGYLAYANYRFPVRAGIFNYMSVQARFDGMTAHSDSRPDDTGRPATTDPARNRITAGSTLSYYKSKYLFADIRLNYEKYFYHHDYAIPDGQGDRIVVELVLRF